MSIESTTLAIAQEIIAGREAAHAKHGANSIEAIDGTDPRWLSILVEEVGELAHEMTYDAGDAATVRQRIRAEALDVAAVAIALIASIDRAPALPGVINTEEELALYPVGTIISDGSDDLWVRGEGGWLAKGHSYSEPSLIGDLPARVLYVPDA